MSLAKSLETARSKPKFEEWIATLDDEDREALFAAAVDPRISTTAIEIAVRAAGASVSSVTMLPWRRANGFTG